MVSPLDMALMSRVELSWVTGRTKDDAEVLRIAYWGYSHHSTNRKDDVGFRLVLDPTKNAALVKRRPLFRQKNKAWMTEDEDEALEGKPAGSPETPKE
jgi:hypothetical protein